MKAENKEKNVKLGSFSAHWNPKDYLNEFYSPPLVVADELEAIKFQVDFLKTLAGKPLALEFGCGPTAHRTIAVAPYVSEIHMADFVPGNLEEVQKWTKEDSGSHDWDHYVKYILECEGIINPTEEQIEKRKVETRKKVTRFIQADAGITYPLGEKYNGYYPHVFSGFCADSATDDRRVWEKFMRNIASLVAPNGTFFTAALRKAKYYRAGENYFPSANVDEHDIERVLGLDFLPESITIEVRELPELEEHGYQGIILAHAKKGE